MVGQFPHLYPTWIAIGYDVYGLTGARYVLGLWAIFGVLAVYFAGAALLGRPAAFAGAALLTVHVAQVWYARFPNSEMIMQALAFAGLLAYARAHVDNIRCFAPLAAVLLGLTFFAHFTGILVIGGVAAATLFGRCDKQPVIPSFVITLVALGCGGLAYYLTVLSPYMARPLNYLDVLQPLHLALLAGGTLLLVGLGVAIRREATAATLRTWLPTLLLAAVWLLSAYALFFREAGGRLAPHDADGLRTYVNFYLFPIGLLAALIGWTLVSGRRFWRGSALLTVGATFSFFIFYKARIVPEHFWMARRFLAVILPISLLLVGTAAFARVHWPERPWLSWTMRPAARVTRAALGGALIAWLGWHYFEDTRPILRHVELAGLIPKLEAMAGRFTSDDLLLVESRSASDTHVLATPLNYIYARNTMVFDRSNPDKLLFRSFLDWARQHYSRVFFIGGGGTDLLSRRTAVRTVGGDRFQIPQYERALNAYPTEVQYKEFDYGIYEFVDGMVEPDVFDLDVGTDDDLYVRRIHAKQHDERGVTYRWTRSHSFVSVLGTRPSARTLTLRMSNGGRPAEAGEARVRLLLNDRWLDTVTVGEGFQPYTVAIPPELARTVAAQEEASLLVIETDTWIPREILGGSDDRDLGVMVDRIEIR